MTHSAATYLTRARQLLQSGNTTDAVMALSEAIHKNPDNRDLLHTRAHAFIALKNLDQAAEDLDSLIAAHPHDAEALDDRGVLHQWKGDYLQAAEYHMRATDIAPSDGVILNLAIALNYLGQKAEAEKLYAVVLQINPANTRALINLAVLQDERGHYEEAENYLKEAIAQGDKSFELGMVYGNVCRKTDRKEEALKWYQSSLALQPQNGPAQFLVSLMKGENPEAPPQEHVASLFDSYADNFEDSLVIGLKYRTPELLFKASEKELDLIKEKNTIVNSMDLGAGTGLFGKILRPYATHSIGLDLSSKMLEKAQEQNIYDDVLCMDMIDGLQRYNAGHFQIISAADVLVYIGKLDELFKTVHVSLASGGLYIFSTEAMAETETGDYQARDTGRYAHNVDYLRRLADQNNFEMIHLERTWIRYNKDQPLDGFIVVLKKI